MTGYERFKPGDDPGGREASDLRSVDRKEGKRKLSWRDAERQGRGSDLCLRLWTAALRFAAERQVPLS